MPPISFVAGPVTVEVPATSANLGPGYDCLGIALDLVDTIVGEVVPEGLALEVHGEGCDEVPLDETHLVVRAMRVAFGEMGAAPTGLRLSFTNRIPHSRGLGSSSAAIVGGIVLARALVEHGERVLDDEGVLHLATRMEGHPDNVAPALLGGFVVSGQSGESVWAQRSPVDPALSAVVFVPPEGVSTEAARDLLPASIPHCDAAANSGRAALLVTALAGETQHLLRATEDFLHQEQRAPAMPRSLALVHALRDQGIAAVVSGAGPSVLALLTGEPGALLLEAGPSEWRTLHQRVGGPGATVLM